MANGGPGVVIVESGGLPVTQVSGGGNASPFTVVESNGFPVTLVDTLGIAVALYNLDGSEYSGFSLTAPVLAFASATDPDSDNTQDLDITVFAPAVDDVLTVEWDNNSDFSSVTGSDTYTIVLADLSDFTGEITTDALADGAQYFRAKHSRGAVDSAWSNTVTKVIDATVPTVSSFSPADNATDVAIDTDLVVTFSEPVALGASGTITLKKTSDDSTVDSWDVSADEGSGAGQLEVLNDDELHLHLTGDIDNELEVYVIWDAGVVEDAAGNDVAALSTTTIWSFTTVAAAGYTATATTFDGTNDYIVSTQNPPTGLVDGKVGLFSMWAKLAADGTIMTFARTDTNARFLVQKLGPGSSNKFRITGVNAAGSTILLMTSTTSMAIADGWVHWLASWNLATPVGYLYRNGVNDLAAGGTYTDDTIDYTNGNLGFFRTSAGVQLYNGDVSEFFFTNEFLDLSVQANREKFILASKPVDLGADGSTPTGTQPIIYFANPYTSFETNLGSGGTMTLTGTLTEASTSPSD